MCKLYKQERRIWRKMRLELAEGCTLEVACQKITDETNCPMAKECKKVNDEIEAWLKGKHRKRGRN